MKKILLITICFLISANLLAQHKKSPFNKSIPEVYIETSLNARQLKTISQDFSIDKVTKNEDGCYDVRLCIGKKEYPAFEKLGIPFSFVTMPKAFVTMAYNYQDFVSSWNRYPTYDTYLATMDTFQHQFPDLCKIDTILAQTPGGHSLLVAHISNDLDNRGSKPAFFYTSTMHGDESVGYYMMLHLIHYLLHNYDTDSKIQQLIDNIDIWICPLENPDGTYHTNDVSLNTSPRSTRYNYNNIDLNRSYPIAGSTYDPNGDYEPEVRAMMDFGAEHHFTMSANFHGGAEVFNFPWDTWSSDERINADDNWWRHVGRKFADTCHQFDPSYMDEMENGISEGGDWYCITGSRQDFFNYYLGCREVTIEISDAKVLSSENLPNYWNKLHHSLINYIGESLNGLRGTITDSLTGMPIRAKVFISGHDVDSSHTYSLLPEGDYHRPIKGGTYAVTFSAPQYHSKTINITAVDGQCTIQDVQLTPIDYSVEQHDQQAFVLFPNPTSGILYITSMARPPLQYVMQILDQQGKMVYTSTIEAGTSTLNISDLPSGLYFIRIIDKGTTIYNSQIIKK